MEDTTVWDQRNPTAPATSRSANIYEIYQNFKLCICKALKQFIALGLMYTLLRNLKLCECLWMCQSESRCRVLFVSVFLDISDFDSTDQLFQNTNTHFYPNVIWPHCCLLLRTVQRDPRISVKSNAPSLMAWTSMGSATSGSLITEVRMYHGILWFTWQMNGESLVLFWKWSLWQLRIPVSSTACQEGRTFSTAIAALWLMVHPATRGARMYVWMECARWVNEELNYICVFLNPNL